MNITKQKTEDEKKKQKQKLRNCPIKAAGGVKSERGNRPKKEAQCNTSSGTQEVLEQEQRSEKGAAQEHIRSRVQKSFASSLCRTIQIQYRLRCVKIKLKYKKQEKKTNLSKI